MPSKVKEKDDVTKAKFAKKYPAMLREIAKNTGVDDEHVDQIGATADAIFAPYAPSE